MKSFIYYQDNNLSVVSPVVGRRHLVDEVVPQGKFYEAHGIIDTQFCDEVLAMCFYGTDTQE